jgi:hypothetical protein
MRPIIIALALILAPAPALACDEGPNGGHYGGGHSGDDEQHGSNNCRNFCFYVPMPTQPKESPGCLVPLPFHCDPRRSA